MNKVDLERKHELRKAPKLWEKYLPHTIVVSLVAAALLLTFRVSPALQNESASADSTPATGSRTDTSKLKSERTQFVNEMKAVDAELLDKWQRMKRSRRNPQAPGHARRHFEKQLDELEVALEKYQADADIAGTVAWGLKQDIEKLTSDAPERN